mmetsp:Transcript_20864/g.62171  ORF Transcript_20864/g.62171 Transcript_20864/m.62171 type:complete len:326 (-) Transcript_20864:575-1552(-)
MEGSPEEQDVRHEDPVEHLAVRRGECRRHQARDAEAGRKDAHTPPLHEEAVGVADRQGVEPDGKMVLPGHARVHLPLGRLHAGEHDRRGGPDLQPLDHRSRGDRRGVGIWRRPGDEVVLLPESSLLRAQPLQHRRHRLCGAAGFACQRGIRDHSGDGGRKHHHVRAGGAARAAARQDAPILPERDPPHECLQAGIRDAARVALHPCPHCPDFCVGNLHGRGAEQCALAAEGHLAHHRHHDHGRLRRHGAGELLGHRHRGLLGRQQRALHVDSPGLNRTRLPGGLGRSPQDPPRAAGARQPDPVGLHGGQRQGVLRTLRRGRQRGD